VVAVLLAGAACGGEASSSASAKSSTINVFAASSLTEVFTKLADEFTAAPPETRVVLNFAGSNDLVTQLQQGAPAEVFASADMANMDTAGGLVNAPQVFAGNTLAIAVAPGNPEHVAGLADLSRADLKVVLAAPEVPAGKYASEIITRAGVSVAPVSFEVTVKGVVTKIALGEADAGIVYVTDVTAAKGKIESVPIPATQNLIASYPIATLVSSGGDAQAQAFVDLVLSDQGQRVLASYGFLPPPSAAQ
jgi:molybdate transport system substrate-binding protein